MEHMCPSFEDPYQQNFVSSPLMFCGYALETHYFENGMVWCGWSLFDLKELAYFFEYVTQKFSSTVCDKTLRKST